MGWTSFNIDKHTTTTEVLLREMQQDTAGGTRASWEVIDHAIIGATWYAIIKRTLPCGTAIHYGQVVLTERRTPKGSRTTEFFYKDMTEDCGPHAYDMPARMLDMLERLSPPVGPYAATWRQLCRENHAAKRAKAKARARQKADTLTQLQRFIADRFIFVKV